MKTGDSGEQRFRGMPFDSTSPKQTKACNAYRALLRASWIVSRLRCRTCSGTTRFCSTVTALPVRGTAPIRLAHTTPLTTHMASKDIAASASWGAHVSNRALCWGLLNSVEPRSHAQRSCFVCLVACSFESTPHGMLGGCNLCAGRLCSTQCNLHSCRNCDCPD